MKINTLNKTITKGVFLASCFAALSLTSLQADDYLANAGQKFTFNDIIDTTGGSIGAFDGGRLTFNNAMLYKVADVRVESSFAENAMIDFVNSTVYADQIAIGENSVGTQSILLENSSLYVANTLAIGRHAQFLSVDSNLKADIVGLSPINSGMHLQNTNFVGSIVDLEYVWFHGKNNTWKVTDYTGVGYLEINSETSLTLEYNINWHYVVYFETVFIAHDSELTLNIGLDEIFTDEMLSNCDGIFYWNIFDSVSTSAYWGPGTFGDGSLNVNILTSNSNYKWDVVHIEADVYEFSNFEKIPEPSTYAMIFGVLALGLAIYRRRK